MWATLKFRMDGPETFPPCGRKIQKTSLTRIPQNFTGSIHLLIQSHLHVTRRNEHTFNPETTETDLITVQGTVQVFTPMEVHGNRHCKGKH